MPPTQQSGSTRRVVVAHAPDPSVHAAEHERRSLLGFTSRLAALLGHADGGLYDAAMHRHAQPYFVPDSTLCAPDAAALGIDGMQDLFGAVVPHAFVGTKAICHPLVRPGAATVPGWDEGFAPRVRRLVLAGFTAFDVDDARAAGTQLLARGPVRLKTVQARGGLGQTVVADARALEAALEAVDAADVAAYGLVLEEDLDEVVTFSVGQVQVGEATASYFGTQRRTRNNDGDTVFGGSDLDVVRGGLHDLAAQAPSAQLRAAVSTALAFHEAAHACYAGLYASRANYDVLLGRDAGGLLRCAVLEQSWRVGGATGAEISALEAFAADPSRRRVRASCFEVFGPCEPPPAATVYFRGVDAEVGPLTKYTVLQPDDVAR